MQRSIEIPCPSFDLTLSQYDTRFPAVYSKRIHCFSLADNIDHDHITDVLHQAYIATVQELPWLAGSIVPVSPEKGGRPWLREIVASGSAVVIVKDLSKKIKFADLRKANFSQALLDTDELCPLPQAIYMQQEPIPVCRLQANFVDGGLLLAVSIAHIACDGRGISQVTSVFAEKLRAASSNGSNTASISGEASRYSFNRNTIINGKGFPGNLEDHKAWARYESSPANAFKAGKSTCRTFRISNEQLALLKDEALASLAAIPVNNLRISTHDAIAALIWRSVITARHRTGKLEDASSTAKCLSFVDCRSRLGLMEPYYGNVIDAFQASLIVADLSSELSLGVAAIAIRKEVNSITADSFRDIVAYIERTMQDHPTSMSGVNDLRGGTMALTSYWGFGTYDVDFGLLGKIESFRLPSRGIVPGIAIILPRCRDGSCEFNVNEDENVLKEMVGDELFARFAVGLE